MKRYVLLLFTFLAFTNMSFLKSNEAEAELVSLRAIVGPSFLNSGTSLGGALQLDLSPVPFLKFGLYAYLTSSQSTSTDTSQVVTITSKRTSILPLLAGSIGTQIPFTGIYGGLRAGVMGAFTSVTATASSALIGSISAPASASVISSFALAPYVGWEISLLPVLKLGIEGSYIYPTDSKFKGFEHFQVAPQIKFAF